MQLGVVLRNLLVLIGLALAPFLMGAAQRPSSERPIPLVERFVHGQGLQIRLTVRRATVAAFEDPGFEVVFENVGRTPINLNPHVASNVYIYGADGKLVPAYRSWIAEQIVVVLKRAELVVLQPGQRLSRRARAEFHPANDMGQGAMYVDAWPGAAQSRLMLRGGVYTARFVYLNAPGFPAAYDLREIADIWEGRLESEPVTFTVAAGAESELDPPAGRPALGAVQADAPYPASVAEAVRTLALDDQRQVVNAMDMLARARSTISIPALRSLLTHPVPWKRASAASAILRMGDERMRDVVMSIINDPVTSLRAQAVNWLVAHCTTDQLPLIRELAATGSPALTTGLAHCGSAETFADLRPLMDSADRATAVRGLNALYSLTFEGSDDAEVTWRATPGDWDSWYAQHRNESRLQWAERHIRADSKGAWRAADYLRRVSDRRVLTVLRTAAASANASVRVLAARGIARFERTEGIALLKAELENRNPQVCADALAALNEITDHHYAFDFHLPAERSKAIAEYAAISN